MTDAPVLNQADLALRWARQADARRTPSGECPPRVAQFRPPDAPVLNQADLALRWARQADARRTSNSG
ncbi:hypothetical protein P3T27_007534 [Kitasatospora sp. MAA19]|nr:hypothetical protein [Kitasatospora sp. MAA19]